MHPDLQQRRCVGAGGSPQRPRRARSRSHAGPRTGRTQALTEALLRELPRPIRLEDITLASLATAFGGAVRGNADVRPLRFVPLEHAAAGDLAPFLTARRADEAAAALARGASLLVDAALAAPTIDGVRPRGASPGSLWIHTHAAWAMAKVLADYVHRDDAVARLGEGVSLGPHVSLSPRVTLGHRVQVGASSVIGSPGFGWATGPHGDTVPVPQLGGVVIEDDVWVGPLVTIDAGTLGPTIVRRGAKLDAHVHVGHNCDIGEGTFVAAQCGFAGSVRIGRNVQIGGQVGIADHVTVGDGARIAAKSGVIGDVPAGAVFAGYPAVPRTRWLRGLASVYRALR